MLYEILTQLVQFLSTLLALLAARYLMELSTIQEDMLALDRFLYGMYRQWTRGSFDNLVLWYRIRKLLDYDE